MTVSRRALLGAPLTLMAAALLAGCGRKAQVRVPDGEPDNFPRTYPPARDRDEEERRR